MGLFDNVAEIGCCRQDLGPGAVLLPGFALPDEALLLTALQKVVEQAPFRHMVTPGGFRMSVAMTNCGSLGWISDETGYRYDNIDPDSGRTWPSMPDSFLKLATGAAEEAGFQPFKPDACPSIATRQARGFRCIRTRMNAASASRSSRFRWVSPRLFFSVARRAVARQRGFQWCTVT